MNYMNTGANFIKQFELSASSRLKKAGFSISIIKVDALPSKATEISLIKKSKHYLIWFADNRLDYDSGVMVNRVDSNQNKWENIIFPIKARGENMLSFYPEQAGNSIEKITNFLTAIRD